jgi:uncharacterized iron-regulated membrane protein
MPEKITITAHRAPEPLIALIKRLHFYIGVLVGPFLLVAALSGILYASTPQIESRLYDQALHTDSQGLALSLEAQVRVAQAKVGGAAPVAAVRPAPAQGETTRVMFTIPGLGASEHRAIFVDPVNGQIRGDMTVYGTSGVLPLRTWIDQFHRGLMLGDIGRLYSELAASWLWVAALGGAILWLSQRRKMSPKISIAAPKTALRRLHTTTGLWLLIGLLFFSATGLTWSQWAGGNIGVLRGYWGWSTPSVSTALGKPAQMSMPVVDEHAGHHMDMGAHKPSVLADLSLFDKALARARAEKIDAAKIEIRPASDPDSAWVIREIDGRWPTQVDAVSIDPDTLNIVDKVEFVSYPLAAKLTRWGIDAHMGVLFGLANQLVLVAFASGLAVMVVLGYVMWWRRRPTRSRVTQRQPTLVDAWRLLNRKSRWLIAFMTVVCGLSLPVMGCSLLGLIALDLLLSARRSSGALIEKRG